MHEDAKAASNQATLEKVNSDEKLPPILGEQSFPTYCKVVLKKLIPLRSKTA